MALVRLCCSCQERRRIDDREMCAVCADTFDDQLTGLLEAAAGSS